VRLLIYSQDGRGLGHLRRTGNIALRVLARRPGALVLTLADSRSTPVVAAHPGMDVLKLPTLVKTGRSSSQESSWRPATLPLAIREALALRSRLILAAFEEFRPDVVLVDHMPVGALGELKPVLERARAAQPRPRLFLGLRDVLDAASTVRRAWRELGAYDYLPAYDAVLVYGCREIYDAERAYELGPHAQKVVFCHYVAPHERRLRVTAKRGPMEPPYVLVMGGGGGDAYPLASCFLDAAPALRRALGLRAMVLTGPSMSPVERHALLRRADGRDVWVETSREDVSSLLRGAAAVTMMAGYNSLCEVVAAGKKALVVPRAGPSAEQRIRSRLFAERRLIRVLDPDELTPARLARELLELLREDAPAPRFPLPLDGAARAADLLLEGSSAVRERPSLARARRYSGRL
jgi:predicted glycosyltransferase